jgi:hypothetical protein
MNESNLPFHIKLFNERVRAMNQSNGKLLTLNTQEARNLHAEIYDLMAIIADLGKQKNTNTDSVNINMDGGSFR